MPSASISPSLRQLVRLRAQGFCEYCHYPDSACYASFNCDHCIPQRLDGPSSAANLAWACPVCNAAKSDKVSAMDPQSRTVVDLFNPRLEKWENHFRWSPDGLEIEGLTPTGRATIAFLQMNRPKAREIRRLLLQLHRHPGQPGRTTPTPPATAGPP
jgi:hypothetical protein